MTDFDPSLDLKNTQQLSLSPQPPRDYESLETTASTTKPVVLRLILSGETFLQTVNYPVLVEVWQKLKHGRQRRLWEQRFSAAERKKIAGYYAKFYRWHLIEGTPRQVAVSPRTLELLQQAVALAAEIT